MNKKVISIIAIVAIIAILGVVLVACNADSVAKKLEKKGYEVATLTEDSEDIGGIVYGIVSSEDGFKEGLIAANEDGDIVIAVWFNDKEAAEDLENNKALKVFKVNVERSGKVVYIGTEQGIKDAK